ncbi:metal ABC transporter substrate-binding protein [Gordonia sp. zg691]|uniref:Metal ABC transporter substrate-binding protein n=1 Tax=Gordonia jinghuaiqii TaxID=2758710 RepID=A0A7D7RD25_9ACTN|nr:MetQ/NlpA family ABC transporter substrate-binding protein [Gordonia jinghuaiqii]MBD0863805.1 metal ABC transporter substrate-binding protein [Gordonia jinghuaiqii]MCR5979973.1 metal ABC transporter substrate-binding protein [Gordonia jinghuaiqii]QMT03170.1 metal ABC transporter substrate-binding protein [Gordonia jinghuaiqii]
MTTTDNQDAVRGDGADRLEIRRRPRWIWIAIVLVGAVTVAAGMVFAAGGDDKSPNEIAGATLVIATDEGCAGEQALVEFIAEKVAPKYGIKVENRGLSDSTTINRAVSEGEFAGTLYQHKLWLKQVLEANSDFEEIAVTPVFRWGFGIWSEKYNNPVQLPDGATVSLYSDPANEAQGLWLLERAGLIKLDPDAEKWRVTQKDIIDNPKNLKFLLLDFAAQSRSLPDLDAAVGYTYFYQAAKVSEKYQIFAPPPPDEFAGQLTIGTKWADTENIKKLVAAFKDPAVQEFLATDPSVKGGLLPLQ